MHRLLIIGAGLTVVAALVAALLAPKGPGSSLDGVPGAGTSSQWVGVHRTRRTYELHVPARIAVGRGSRPVPLVIVLHGSDAMGDDLRTGIGLDSIADALGFVTTYPDGTRGVLGGVSDWNAGNCCGAARLHDVDDMLFIRRLIGDVSAHLPIDRHRIYIAGFSDGGRMTYRLACEMAPAIAGIVVASGSLTTPRCRPGGAVPLIAFHGTDDDEVAYDEAVPSSVWTPPDSGAALASLLPPAVRYWATVDGCGVPDSARVAPHVVRIAFARCTRAPVTFFRLEGARHGWPTGTSASAGDGVAMTEISAARVLADAFLR